MTANKGKAPRTKDFSRKAIKESPDIPLYSFAAVNIYWTRNARGVKPKIQKTLLTKESRLDMFNSDLHVG